MPKYMAKLTVPAANTILNPVKADLKIGQGVISHVSVTWTPGSQWLNCFRALYNGAQIIPSEGGGECRGDGYPDEWDEYIIIDEVHPVLKLEAWNAGNSYEHDVLFNIIIMPSEAKETNKLQEIIDAIRRVFG